MSRPALSVVLVLSAVLVPSHAHAEPTSWQRIIDRPLTLERGRVGLYGDVSWNGGYVTFSTRDRRAATSRGKWAFARRVTVGGGYGVTDDWTLGAQYNGGTRLSLAHDPFADRISVDHPYDRGELTLFAAYRLAEGPCYSVAATVSASQDLEPNRQGVAVGITARYRFTRRLAVFTGGNSIAPTYSTKLAFGNAGAPSALAASAALEFQWTRRFYVSIWAHSWYQFAPTTDYEVSTSLRLFVTVSKHVDVGAYAGAFDLGLVTFVSL